MASSSHCELVVLGSGPGGYTAAFRAADLGKKVTLIERYANIGGVCLNVGCIPSKALLHAAKVIDDAAAMEKHGIHFGQPTIDIKKLSGWKDHVVGRLTKGLTGLAKQRQVQIVQGMAKFLSNHSISIVSDSGEQTLTFDQCIIAVGSRPIKLPFLPDDPRVMDSTSALKLARTDGDLLVIGGGIIGCEMATVYRALGAKVSIVEFMDSLMPGADKDLSKAYHKFVSPLYQDILLNTKVEKVDAKKDGLWVSFSGQSAPEKPRCYQQILAAVGRESNADYLDLAKTDVHCNNRNLISVDQQMRTQVEHIFAIGDVIGQPMLAHKASHQAKIAAEVVCGMKHYYDVKCVPSVAYTDPEVAWTGLTEQQAKEQGIAITKGVFPWAASGRALGNERTEGMTKMIFDAEKNTLLGAGIVGVNAGELIAEASLAIEMGCDAEDIALTIHPHPTLSETLFMATEMAQGTITDLYVPKKK